MEKDDHDTLMVPAGSALDPHDEPTLHGDTTARRLQNMTPYWLAVAATLFLALWGWREIGIRVMREQAITQKSEMTRLQGENERLTQLRERLTGDLESLAAADSQTIDLAGQKTAPEASGRVFLNPGKKRAIAFFYKLPPNAADKVYQLWIVAGDNAQVTSGGTFDVGESGGGTVTVQNVPEGAKAFTVTVEPHGGAQQPSGEIVITGNVR